MGIIYDYFSRKIFWEPFRVVCFIIFGVIIVMYLFFPPLATLMLFGYISLWSRIPCMVADYTKDLDTIDFFAVIIAVHLKSPLSGLYAGLFSAFVMMFSRLFGPDEDVTITITESMTFFIISVFVPVIHLITNNLFYTLLTFTILRYIIDQIIVTIFFRHLFWYGIFYFIIGPPIAYAMNKIMVILFGAFFATVFETGLRFNFPLFMFAIILTVAANYIPIYIRKKEIIDKTTKEIKRKERVSENHIADDNYENYPQFFNGNHS